MSTYQYPETIYDTPETLLATLGSWWADLYDGRDQVLELLRARGQVENQAIWDLAEAIAAVSRFSVPIYHRENWYPLQLLKSQVNNAAIALLQYDGGGAYDTGYAYDVPPSSPYFAFPVPADLVVAPTILNRFLGPTLTLHDGLDYVLRPGVISFQRNPFDDPRVAVRTIYTDGVPTDAEATLWVYQGDMDWDLVYQQFGYIVDLKLKSSAGYRQLLNAILDGMVGGCTQQDVLWGLAAMLGAPLVLEATETVVDIVTDTHNLVIITDQHVYKFATTAVPTVSVGDRVVRGQSLTDVLQVFELNRGQIPENLSLLSTGSGLLATCFYSDLIFENREIPLEVEEDVDGYTKISWGLGGFPADVDKFFTEMHTRGVAAASASATGKGTLAHYLDVRPNPTTEPTALNLPVVVNPLAFLIENILRNNACLIRVRPSSGFRGVGLQGWTIFRKIMPAHVAVILLVDLPKIQETVAVETVTDGLGSFIAAAALDDTVSTVQDSHLTSSPVYGACY